MATLRPFRDYDEKDVVNLFGLHDTSLDSTQDLSTWAKRLPHGTLVALQTGWKSDQELAMLEDAGAASAGLKNVTTQRYGVAAKVFPSQANGADRPFGMTLHHVAHYDENGEQLKFNPRKAAELEACIVGQAIPLVRRGMFLINGVAGTPAAGGAIYGDANGGLTATDAGSSIQVGIALGAAAGGNTLVLLDIDHWN